ncbi:MAG: hypothetical protein IKY74_06220 [Alistipes sp.]|nr:hypothetical protein [Alistipes sp.]
MEYREYIIADLRLRSEIDLVALGLSGFKPFETDCTGVVDCYIKQLIGTENGEIELSTPLATSYLAEADADGVLYKTTTGYTYSIHPRNNKDEVTIFDIDCTTNTISTNSHPTNIIDRSILRFGIWVMFGVALAQNRGVAIHSSAIVADGRCAIFLGESGTGKSTHTRLWRENIKGARLLNDDSPIVRIVGNEVRVYGSPWSGKTPCYKSEVYPLSGLCRIVQAPYNRITRLSTISAIGALLPSCPPMFAYDGDLQDAICNIVGSILRSVPAYRLECLPDSDAAMLSYKMIMLNE